MTRSAESDRFEEVWVTADRAAHTPVVRVPTGKGRGAIGVSEGTVTLDVGATVGRVKAAIDLVIARRYYLDRLLHFLRIALRTPIVLSTVIALGACFIGLGRLVGRPRGPHRPGGHLDGGPPPAPRPRSGPPAPSDPSGSSRPAPRTTDTDASLGRTALPEPKRAAHPERRGRLSNAREGDER
ncbi:hypothetical protein ACFYUJ_30240 [Streptomyces sp. NPDC004520]|uniref:hypothetical protein n=1 Tax=Streptomyces sp. NPDC004520 TaxID=3364702 RepID=UPI0036A6180C